MGDALSTIWEAVRPLAALIGVFGVGVLVGLFPLLFGSRIIIFPRMTLEQSVRVRQELQREIVEMLRGQRVA